jgi:ABC-type transport system substrate-binding protein
MPSLNQTTQVMTRRHAVRLLALGAGAGVVAACSGVPQAPPAATPVAVSAVAVSATPVAVSATPAAAATPVAGQPKTGGTLKVGVPNDIVTLDGLVRGGAPYESIWLIYDRLITYDDKLKPLPMLAESWDVTPDYTQVQLNLRKGVTCHSGRDFTNHHVRSRVMGRGGVGHKYNAMYATGDVVANLLPINNLNGPTWRPSPNNTDWNTPEWKDLFAQVATEADPAKQKTLCAKLNDYILDQSWAMPMATNPQVLVGTTKLKGVSVNQYGAWYFTDAWLDS